MKIGFVIDPRGAFKVLITAALLIAASPAWSTDDTALQANRGVWQAAQLEHYVYAYLKFCDCNRETPPETHVTVRGGKIVDVRHKPHGFDHYVQAEPRNFEWYWTVEQLFGLIDSALERGAELRVEYDPTLGYPIRLFIDRNRDVIGDEIDLELTRLEALED